MNAYRCCLFNMMTYLLLNSEYGIGCGYSPVSTWFGDVCGIRTDFSIFSGILCLFFQILFIAAAYAKSPGPMQYRVPRACKAALLQGDDELCLVISGCESAVCRRYLI